MSKPRRLRRGAGYGACADDAGFGEAPQQALSRGPRRRESGKCVHTCPACHYALPRKRVHFQGTRFLCIGARQRGKIVVSSNTTIVDKNTPPTCGCRNRRRQRL